MNNTWIIGGTTEGRTLAEALVSYGIPVYVSVASEYGSHLMKKNKCLTVITARMEEAQMEAFLKKYDISLVLDASHPYASLVTAHAKAVCEKMNVSYQRIIRKEENVCAAYDGGARLIWKDTVKEGAEYLAGVTGNIFVTTGSKELKEYTSIPEFEQRVYARVLPDSKVIEACGKLHIPGNHLIAMQGPFSRELNLAMYGQAKASWLVTKESGKAGGFREKIDAAMECNMNILMIGRPKKEEGITVEEAKRQLCKGEKTEGQQVALVGTGMGNVSQLTVEALDAVAESDAVLGAPRLLESLKPILEGKVLYGVYQPELMLDWLDAHKEYRTPCVLFSGDTGFYSGAGNAARALEESGRYKATVIPGISSLSYLCSRLRTNWEDVCMCSLHGRDDMLEEKLEACEKVFVLLGGRYLAEELMERLIKSGYDKVKVSVGERLSYPEERITVGTPKELTGHVFDKLCAVLIETRKER